MAVIKALRRATDLIAHGAAQTASGLFHIVISRSGPVW
jgi:hypothetical protein